MQVATLSTKSRFIFMARMNGMPRITLTATSLPAAILGELHLTVGHGDQPLLKLYVLSPRDEELMDFVAARWRRTTTETPRTYADE